MSRGHVTLGKFEKRHKGLNRSLSYALSYSEEKTKVHNRIRLLLLFPCLNLFIINIIECLRFSLIYYLIPTFKKHSTTFFPQGLRMEADDFLNLHKIPLLTVPNMFVKEFIPG